MNDKKNIEALKNFKKSAWSTKKKAKIYDKNIYLNKFFLKIKNRVEYYYVKKFASGNMLDAGAGTGRFSLRLLDDGFNVISSDISYSMLEIAKNKNSLFKGLVSDIYRLPFKDSCFDTIISITVLEHFSDYEKIIAEFSRIIKPGGRIIFEMPSSKNLSFLDKNFKQKDSENVESFFSTSDIQNMKSILKKFNFNLLHAFPYDFFNNNQILKKIFLHKKIYKVIYIILNIMFKIPGTIYLFFIIERLILSRLPEKLCFNIMYISQKPR